MAFAGILKDEDVAAAISACSGKTAILQFCSFYSLPLSVLYSQ